MKTLERIELLREAQHQLLKAIENIFYALKGTEHEAHANAYILSHLEDWIDASGSYNMGIEQYIEELEYKEQNQD